MRHIAYSNAFYRYLQAQLLLYQQLFSFHVNNTDTIFGVCDSLASLLAICLFTSICVNTMSAQSHMALLIHAKRGCISASPLDLQLVCNNKFCFFVKYMNLFNIETKLNLITRSCCCTGINPCCDREAFQIKVQINFCAKQLIYINS